MVQRISSRIKESPPWQKTKILLFYLSVKDGYEEVLDAARVTIIRASNHPSSIDLTRFFKSIAPVSSKPRGISAAQ